MRLANGIIIDKEKTFGVLKFSALRREIHIQNEDGTVSQEIKERTYDLKCTEQGRMIQVSIPASVKNKNGQPAGNNHAPNNPQQPQHKK